MNSAMDDAAPSCVIFLFGSVYLSMYACICVRLYVTSVFFVCIYVCFPVFLCLFFVFVFFFFIDVSARKTWMPKEMFYRSREYF